MCVYVHSPPHGHVQVRSERCACSSIVLRYDDDGVENDDDGDSDEYHWLLS